VIALQRSSAHFRGRCQRQCVCKRNALHLVYARIRVHITRFRVQSMRFRAQNRRLLSCGRGESNSQGVVQAPHSLPRRARLPVSSRPRRVETRRGLVAAGIICRWLPPRVHSFSGVPGRSRTGFSRSASQAADRSPSGTRPTPGQECSTTPGRFYYPDDVVGHPFAQLSLSACTRYNVLTHPQRGENGTQTQEEARSQTRSRNDQGAVGRCGETGARQEATCKRLAQTRDPSAPEIAQRSSRPPHSPQQKRHTVASHGVMCALPGSSRPMSARAAFAVSLIGVRSLVRHEPNDTFRAGARHYMRQVHTSDEPTGLDVPIVL
jgi:hypothetical protein